MIRLREIEKWLHYRGRVGNAWQLATARRRAPAGSPLPLVLPEIGICTIRAGTTDHRVFDEVFIRDAYRLSGPTGPQKRLGTVVDVGAHIGIFAIRAARVAERVHSFEPVEENRRLLEANLRSTGTTNVTVHPYALGDTDGEAVIHHAGHQAGHSLYTELSGPGSREERVPLRRLGTLLDELALGRVDLLKLDCEGAEYSILLGADDPVLQRIDRIRLEFHDLGAARGGRTGAALAARLAAAGFRVTTVASKRSPERGMLWATRAEDEMEAPWRP
jgi:FkbM family methyltransferase